jgi:hypothetical protein
LSLQPVAVRAVIIGNDMVEALDAKGLNRRSASEQALMRMNTEQALKRAMQMPIWCETEKAAKTSLKANESSPLCRFNGEGMFATGLVVQDGKSVLVENIQLANREAQVRPERMADRLVLV